jgi:tetratricopeptide (TPR) repeat protein
MAIETALKNARGVAVAKNNLATVALAEGQTDAALALFAESLRGFRAIDNVRESAFPLLGLADAHIVAHDLDAARAFIDECLKVRREVGDQKGIADAIRALGWLELEAGQDTAALEHVHEAARVAHALKDRRGIAESLSLVAVWGSRHEQHELAVRLSAASHQIRQGFSYARPPLIISRREEALARAKEALGEAVFKRCWLQGTLLTPDQAVEQALKMGSVVS